MEIKQSYTDEDLKLIVGALPLDQRQKMEKLLREKRRNSEFKILLDPQNRKDVPSWKGCRIMFFHNLVPFIGFGFFDNLLMILAGDLIETQIGATMHLSVMACAALGNTISDVCGIGLAGYVEVLALRCGLPVPDLPQAQLNHTRARLSKATGQAMGIIIGCLIGMFPLLFINENK